MSDHVISERQGKVLVVRLSRPERKNALTQDMYSALADALESGHQDDNVRCFLFTGSDECFTAGNDLSDFQSAQPGDFETSPVGRFLFGLAAATKPVVAAVNGPAVGIGTTMLLHCDMVFAGNTTAFRMPFATLGLCPEGGSSLLLPAWLGRVRAAELLMLGDAFSADDAYRLGLINRVCEPAQTEPLALDTCQRLATLPPGAIRATKTLLNRPHLETLADTMRAEGALFGERLQSPEAAEAFQAFADKRKPDFSAFS